MGRRAVGTGYRSRSRIGRIRSMNDWSMMERWWGVDNVIHGFERVAACFYLDARAAIGGWDELLSSVVGSAATVDRWRIRLRNIFRRASTTVAIDMARYILAANGLRLAPCHSYHGGDSHRVLWFQPRGRDDLQGTSFPPAGSDRAPAWSIVTLIAVGALRRAALAVASTS